jgi:hypothetical protein
MAAHVYSVAEAGGGLNVSVDGKMIGIARLGRGQGRRGIPT